MPKVLRTVKDAHIWSNQITGIYVGDQKIRPAEALSRIYNYANRKMIKKIWITILLFLLTTSVALNLFQRRNQAVSCQNLDSYWKADLLYKLWHKHLDWDKDWIPCENLYPNSI